LNVIQFTQSRRSTAFEGQNVTVCFCCGEQVPACCCTALTQRITAKQRIKFRIIKSQNPLPNKLSQRTSELRYKRRED
jgi:hypothetical protein